VMWKARSPEEMHRLEDLAQAAVGYDARRGDQVVMENVSFSTNVPEIKPPAMDRLMEETRSLLHSQPGLMRNAIVGLCGVLLVLFVLRPVARQMTATLREPVLLTARAGMTADMDVQEEHMFAPPILEQEEMLMPRTKNRTQQLQQGIFDHVSEHIRREPAQSTRVLEAWIGSSEEGA
jgi:flagellar M-ring protein FliF